MNKIERLGVISFAAISVLVFVLGLIITFIQGHILSLLIIPILVSFFVSMGMLQAHLTERFLYWIVFSLLLSAGLVMIVSKFIFSGMGFI